MQISLTGKTALVSGSTQGIGKAAAMAMAEAGARIVLLARSEGKLKQVCEELANISNAEHGYIVADFSQPDAVEAAVQKGRRQFGIFHILVNNTGGPPGGPAKAASIDDFRRAFEMHLISNHLLATHCFPGMIEAGYGRIINVISTSVKQPLANLGVSNTIRGAVANWSKTLANELGQFGITVNNVLPGATLTGRLTSIAASKAEKDQKSPEDILEEMAQEVPMKRVGRPEEIANAICFLASPLASYINGINLPIDGGRTGCL